MGGALSSPPTTRQPPHPPTSVCNHLFASPSGDAALFLGRHPPPPPCSWQRAKKVQASYAPIRRPPASHLHNGAPPPYMARSATNETLLSSLVSAERQLPLSALSLHVDDNDNYKSGFRTGDSTSRTSTVRKVIPNVYSIREELSRHFGGGDARRRQDSANNNNSSASGSSSGCSRISSPVEDDDCRVKTRTPCSPRQQPVTTRGTRHIVDLVERDREREREKESRLLLPPVPPPALLSSSAPGQFGGGGSVAIHAPLEIRRRTVLHASTSDLLRGIGAFVARRTRARHFEPAHVVMWMRAVDRALLLQGWQDVAFINPANLVFVFLLMRDVTDDDSCLDSSEGVHQWILTCLYVAYSYMGNEISYPLKPFLVQEDRDSFWSRCVDLVLARSGDMLRLNSSSAFFTQVFTDLKRYANLER